MDNKIQKSTKKYLIAAREKIFNGAERLAAPKLPSIQIFYVAGSKSLLSKVLS